MAMAIPDEVVAEAWTRANGQCECTRITHSFHLPMGCKLTLQWSKRGVQGPDGWEAYPRRGVGLEGPTRMEACEILCWNCYRRTASVT